MTDNEWTGPTIAGGLMTLAVLSAWAYDLWTRYVRDRRQWWE